MSTDPRATKIYLNTLEAVPLGIEPYYEDELITIYHGDCRDVLPLLPKADLILTSPPYNKGMSDDGRVLPSRSRVGHYRKDVPQNARGGHGLWKGNTLSAGYGTHDDAMPYAEYEQMQREVLLLCWDRLSDVGAIYYNHKPRVVDNEVWLPLALNPGLPLRQIVIWARGSGFNFSPTYYTPTHEWVMVFARPSFRLTEGTERSDVWFIPPELNTPHPAPFPLALARRAIATAAVTGLIVDPFMGSGTTLVAAKSYNRRAIGIEIDERWCEEAANRCRQEVLGLSA